MRFNKNSNLTLRTNSHLRNYYQTLPLRADMFKNYGKKRDPDLRERVTLEEYFGIPNF